MSARRLKVLALDEEIPFPLNSGKRIRTWNLMRHLAKRHDITFVCYAERTDPRIAEMERLGIRVVTVPELAPAGSLQFNAGAFGNLFSSWPYSVARHHTARFRNAVHRLVTAESFDLVHCEWTPYASFLPATKNLPAILMAHNMETTVWRRRAEHASHPAERLYMRLQAAKMERFEKRSFRCAQRVAAVTAEEERTAKLWGARATSLVSNGVDTEALQPAMEAPEKNSMLFLGSLDWQPNRDALQFLLREILPSIRAATPTATLHVVGRQPAKKLQEQVAETPGVNWVGEVPDIRPWFARAAVVLVPLRIGGGSRIKILESLAMGKAVVTTSIGAEGLEVTSGKDCLIADGPEAFAQGVVEILRSPERAATLGRQGRALVVERYDWSRLAENLSDAWLATAGSS